MTVDNSVAKHDNLQHFPAVPFSNDRKEGVRRFLPKKMYSKGNSLTNIIDED